MGKEFKDTLFNDTLLIFVPVRGIVSVIYEDIYFYSDTHIKSIWTNKSFF